MSAAIPERIVLVGFMGSGKTTVGGHLARLLDWGFRDLDRWIEERLGLTVREVFERQGEAVFREEEREAAAVAARLRRHVVAAGGGAFAEPETRRLLQAGSVTVWLSCEWTALAARIPDDGSRPRAVSRAKMRDLLAEREPAYRLADLSVDTTQLTAAQTARHIAQALFPEDPPATPR